MAYAPHTIRGAQWNVPSQYHFYMEPQTAVAVPDEGGRLRVHSSAQSIDMVQQAVASALAMPMTDVVVTCRYDDDQHGCVLPPSGFGFLVFLLVFEECWSLRSVGL